MARLASSPHPSGAPYPVVDGAPAATAPPSPAPTGGYRHEAFLWSSVDAFLERCVPFVTDALDAGTPVMVALTPRTWAPLRAALGTAAERVHHVDMEQLGRNPARIIPAWLDFIAEHGGGELPLRGIGEPVWPGRRAEELVECQIHEALLNLAVPTSTPLWLLCPYDTRALESEVLDEARRSHPEVVETSVDRTALAAPAAPVPYAGSAHGDRLFALPLPAPASDAVETTFARGGLAGVRRTVAAHASDAGLGLQQTGDLVLAVNEMAANSLDHGGGHGSLRAWRTGDALVLEVHDRGRLTDPLVGRVTPRPDQERGRGVWIAHQLCDLVQIRSDGDGFTVRISTWL